MKIFILGTIRIIEIEQLIESARKNIYVLTKEGFSTIGCKDWIDD